MPGEISPGTGVAEHGNRRNNHQIANHRPGHHDATMFSSPMM